MTVPTEVCQSEYTGDGVTAALPTGFVFLANTEVDVFVVTTVETQLVEGVGYTLTGAGSGAGGTVTLVDPSAALGLIVRIRRVPDYTQATSLRTQGSFSPAVHERSFDKLTFQTQDLRRRIGILESAGAVGSVVAGNGLSYSSATQIDVNAGAGIALSADAVTVDFGSSGSVANVTKAAASAGVANQAARIDHKHDATTAVAGAIVPGASASEGAASSLARSDHGHSVAVAAPGAVSNVAAAAGAAASLARSDHTHSVSSAAAVSITAATNGAGAAATLALSDHTHAHGALAGGTLHAAATTAVAGFMSAADKTDHDLVVAIRSHVRAMKSTAQTIATGVQSTILFTTSDYDTLSEFSTTTSLFTALASGYYHISGSVATYSAALTATKKLLVCILLNGTPTTYGSSDVVEVAASRILVATVSTTVHLNVGDTLALAAIQDAAATLDIVYSTPITFLAIDRIQ